MDLSYKIPRALKITDDPTVMAASGVPSASSGSDDMAAAELTIADQEVALNTSLHRDDPSPRHTRFSRGLG